MTATRAEDNTVKITLEELRAWVAVVDSGSITAAAEQLEQTTSGISRALSRLESKLQTTLMHRTTRRLALTDEGAIFLEHARQILTSVERAEEQIARRRETPAGRLRINANTPLCCTSSCRCWRSSGNAIRKLNLNSTPTTSLSICWNSKRISLFALANCATRRCAPGC